PEQLAAAIGQGYLPLLDAVAGVSENSRALEAAVPSPVEAIAPQQRQIADRNPTPAHLPDLQAPPQELTAVLARLNPSPGFPQDPPFSAGHRALARNRPRPGARAGAGTAIARDRDGPIEIPIARSRRSPAAHRSGGQTSRSAFALRPL